MSMKYLYYFMETYMDRLRRDAIGGIIKYIKLGHLTGAEIPLPPLDDQKRIAHLLGKVGGLIARRKQHLQQLDNLLKSVFLEMFGDPVRNEKGWDKKPLSEIATVRIGPFGSLLHAEDYISGGIPLINPSHIVNGEIVIDESLTITEEKFNELSSYHLSLNDVIVARRGEIGRCALVRNKKKLLCGTGSMFVRITGEYLPIVLQFMIYRTSLKDYLENNAKGVTMKNLNSSILEKMKVIVPPPDLQNQFAAIVEKVEDLKSRYQQSLADLENLYGALSQKAFKGELDLSRVAVTIDEEETEDEMEPITTEPPDTPPVIELPAPDSAGSFFSAEGRKALISQWLEVYLDWLGPMPFSAQHFMETAQQRLLELLEELEEPESLTTDYDFFQFGPIEYDHVKELIFQALETGHLTQAYDEAGNRVQLTTAKGL